MNEKELLSVCIITKNEEQNIARCLDSLRSYNWEIIVVDTGSTDHTKTIAAKYTEKIYDFTWCDDFSAARNYAISKAKNSFILMLDSDEYVESCNMDALTKQLLNNPQKTGRIKRRNTFVRSGIRKDGLEWVNRIFQKNIFHYEGRIHEQLVSLEGITYDTYKTSLVIGHTGYDLPEKALKMKAERNLNLLNQELICLLEADGVATVQEHIKKHAASPTNTLLPYVLYQIGKSYYMMGNFESACNYFAEGLSYDLNPKLEYVIDMVETYGYTLLNSGRSKDALFFEHIYNEFGDSADFKFLMGLIYMNNEQYENAVQEFLKATKFKECKIVGVNSYMAYYNIGVIYECLENLKNAHEYYQKCGEYEPALRRMQIIGV